MHAKTETTFITLSSWVKMIYATWNRNTFHLPLILQHVIEQANPEEAFELFELLMTIVREDYMPAYKEDDFSTLGHLLKTSAVLVEAILTKGISILTIADYQNNLPNPRRCETDHYHCSFRRAFQKAHEINPNQNSFDFKLIELLHALEKIYGQLDSNEQQEFKLLFEANTAKLLNAFELLGEPILAIVSKDFSCLKTFLNNYIIIPSGYLDFFNPFFKRLDKTSQEKLPIALVKISKQVNTTGLLDYGLNVLDNGGKITIDISPERKLSKFSSMRYYQQLEIVLENSASDLDELTTFLQQSFQLHWVRFLNHRLMEMERKLTQSVFKNIIEEKRQCLHYNVASVLCHTLFKPQKLPRELIEKIGHQIENQAIEAHEQNLKFASKACYEVIVESQNQFKPKA